MRGSLPASPSVPTEGQSEGGSNLDEAVLQRLGEEVAVATNVRAFGLYDYSSYPGFDGGLKPHVVRDELARGKAVFHSDDASEARAEYVRLCHVFIGRRAVEIARTANSVGIAKGDEPKTPNPERETG